MGLLEVYLNRLPLDIINIIKIYTYDSSCQIEEELIYKYYPQIRYLGVQNRYIAKPDIYVNIGFTIPIYCITNNDILEEKEIIDKKIRNISNTINQIENSYNINTCIKRFRKNQIRKYNPIYTTDEELYNIFELKKKLKIDKLYTQLQYFKNKQIDNIHLVLTCIYNRKYKK